MMYLLKIVKEHRMRVNNVADAFKPEAFWYFIKRR